MPSLRDFELQDFPFPVALPLQRVHKLYGETAGDPEVVGPMLACLRDAIRYAVSLVVAHDLRRVAFSQKAVRVLDDVLHVTWDCYNPRWETLWEALVSVLDDTSLVGGGGNRSERTKRVSDRMQELVRQSPIIFRLVSSPTTDAEVDRNWLEATLCEALHALASLSDWHLLRVVDVDSCQFWMGPSPPGAVLPGSFPASQVGHFVVRRRDNGSWANGASTAIDLHPFLVIASFDKPHEVCFFDDMRGPAADTALSEFRRLLGRTWNEAGMGWRPPESVELVGRQFVLDAVRKFITGRDRGVFLLEGSPGSGKTTLMAYLLRHELPNMGRGVSSDTFHVPVAYFFRRTEGVTDPAECLRHVHLALRRLHGLEDGGDEETTNIGQEIGRWERLWHELAARVSPALPQVVLIDAINEVAEAHRDQMEAWLAMLADTLPEGVFVILGTQPTTEPPDRAAPDSFSGQVVDDPGEQVPFRPSQTFHELRKGVWRYNLDSPELQSQNLRDGFEFAQRELASTDLSGQALEQIARYADGNFLILANLCRAVQRQAGRGDLHQYLNRLVADEGDNWLTRMASDLLDSLYSDEWEELINNRATGDRQALRDVVGLIVTAPVPLTGKMIAELLDIDNWMEYRRALLPWLTIGEVAGDDQATLQYAFHHESLENFFRSRLADDLPAHKEKLADYCLRWRDLTEPYERLYALRFGPSHWLETGRTAECLATLLSLDFLEAKAKAGFVFHLAGDLDRTVEMLPEGHTEGIRLGLIESAIRRQIQFLQRHPDCLFQSLWNDCWWYDSDEGAQFPEVAQGRPITSPSARLCDLVESWRKEKEKTTPGFRWLRSRRPPLLSLGTDTLHILQGHFGGITCAAWSADGKRVASGSRDSRVIMWDANSGAELWSAELPGFVHSLSLIDGDRTVVAATRKNIVFLRMLTGAEIARHEFEELVQTVSRDGRRAALVSCPDEECVPVIQVYDLTRRQGKAVLRRINMAWATVRTYESRYHGSGAFQFSPDGTVLACGGRALRVWNVDTGELLWEKSFSTNQLSAFASQIHLMRFSPDGTHIAIQAGEEHVQVLLAANGSRVTTVHTHREWVHDMVFTHHPPLTLMTPGNRFDEIRCWRIPLPRDTRKLPSHVHEIRVLAISPDDSKFVAGGYCGTLVISETRSDIDRPRARQFRSQFSHLQMSTDGRYAVAAHGASLWFWSLPDGGGPHIDSYWGGYRCCDPVFLSDNRRLISHGSGHGGIYLWDAADGELLQRIETSPLEEVLLLNDNHLVGVTRKGSLDGDPRETGRNLIRIWDLQLGRMTACWSGHWGGVTCLAASPDCGFVASGSDDQSIRIWDVASGQTVLCLNGHSEPVQSVAFSPDGSQLASSARREAVRIWDLATDECLNVIPLSNPRASLQQGQPEHRLLIDNDRRKVQLAFHRDGRRLVGTNQTVAHSGSLVRNPTVWTWDVETGECLREANGGGPPSGISGRFNELNLGFRLTSKPVETCIEEENRYTPIGWLPVRFREMQSDRSGRLWAAIEGGSMFLYELCGEL